MKRTGKDAEARARRFRAHRRGLRAETVAAFWLRLRGYAIVERDLRSRLGQIDIIARRGRTIVFVEVKERAEVATALESVLPQQRRRIERSAVSYMAGRQQFSGHDMRFDVVVLSPWRLPRHIVDAWRPDSR